jgi:hypothetical protein
MLYFKSTVALCVICVGISVASDEVRYQSKSYSGRKLDQRKITARSYQIQTKARASRYKPSRQKNDGFFNFFRSDKKIEPKPLDFEQLASQPDYHSDDKHTVKAQPLDSKKMNRTKKMDVSTAKSGKSFKPAAEKPGRDPMLEPRQGIKVPPKEEPSE